MQVLAQDMSGFSNEEFAERVIQAFGKSPQQHAELHSSDASRALELLKPLPTPSRSAAPQRRRLSARDRANLAQLYARA
jgi:hypothetical protein